MSSALLPAHPQVAVIGAGNMGGAMLARLCEAGWAVSVCDVDPLRQTQAEACGALAQPTPLSAVQGLQPDGLVLIAVVDAVQTWEVLTGEQGVLAGLKPGHTVMLCPTLSPQDVIALQARLGAGGVYCIDAPMSGGPLRAREGTMSLMVACADLVFERHAALLQTLSQKIFRISTQVGDGAKTKLVNNLLAAVHLSGAAEALALAERLGLNPHTTLDVMAQSSGQSWIASDRMPRALAGDFAPRAHVTLLEKDTRLAMDMARSVGFNASMGALARDVFAQASAEGLGQEDDAALLKWMRRHR
jgi:3-hydroxyisobutyrate dehydrogenase-like beta-hydroxyacid dehydrogenase